MATVALLKLNFDSGRDHIGMFEPFVLDTVAHSARDDFSVDDVRTELAARHGLGIPANTLRTLLDRLRKHGHVRREGGRYFRTSEHIDVADLKTRRDQVEKRQARLALSLKDYAAKRDLVLATVDEALGLILEFIERYHVAIALGDTAELMPEIPPDDRDADTFDRKTVVVAEFIQNAVFQDSEDAEILQEFIEGYVLQNTLLLRDVALAGRRFQNLHVVLDSRLIFAALGVRGEAEEIAIRELLSLLRETGAITDVFEPTIAEMRRILHVYEERLGTSDGRASLYPTDMTRFFITRRFSPADVRTFAALLERNIKSLGINIREVPPHVEHLTLDEKKLAKGLAERTSVERRQSGDRRDPEREPRVVHDVQCVAGVITLRGGRKATSLDTVGAVFATASAMTIRNVSEWYADEGRDDVPPIIHYLALSNFAWLKRPAQASRLKLHEVVALCAAALRPSREAWETFLRYLRRQQEANELTSDEVTAILVSELTDRVLVDEQVDDDTDADTLAEVVDRVKSTYRIEVEERERIADERVAAAVQTRINLEGRARSIARTCCSVAAVAIALVFFAGAVVSLLGLRGNGWLGVVAYILTGTFAAVGLFSVIWEFNVKTWKQAAEERLARRLLAWWTGDSEAG